MQCATPTYIPIKTNEQTNKSYSINKCRTCHGHRDAWWMRYGVAAPASATPSPTAAAVSRISSFTQFAFISMHDRAADSCICRSPNLRNRKESADYEIICLQSITKSAPSFSSSSHVRRVKLLHAFKTALKIDRYK